MMGQLLLFIQWNFNWWWGGESETRRRLQSQHDNKSTPFLSVCVQLLHIAPSLNTHGHLSTLLFRRRNINYKFVFHLLILPGCRWVILARHIETRRFKSPRRGGKCLNSDAFLKRSGAAATTRGTTEGSAVVTASQTTADFCRFICRFIDERSAIINAKTPQRRFFPLISAIGKL